MLAIRGRVLLRESQEFADYADFAGESRFRMFATLSSPLLAKVFATRWRSGCGRWFQVQSLEFSSFAIRSVPPELARWSKLNALLP